MEALEESRKEDARLIRENNRMIAEVREKIFNGIGDRIAALWRLLWGLLGMMLLGFVAAIIERLVG